MLLGDAGVGKSVMAGVLAQRMKRAGNLGAAYFCRHNDGTRNNPRYLLGTIAYQLCKCNSQYKNVVGGEGGIRKLLGNSDLGVQELFTKLLLESLAKCNSCRQRTLVVIDALDETKYESRDDFLDLIMNRFPLLPKWLVFFITSRPEHTVQFRLKTYNPCIKICSGNSENLNFYQHHEQDIKLFLEKRVDFSFLPYSVEDIAEKCNGLFLYAFFIARFLMDPANSGKIGQLTNLLPRDIEDFFLQNFKRVSNKVGPGLYKKLFGCAIVAPSPLPVSFISFILQREHSDLEEQEITDAVSLFVVLRPDTRTFTFLHNLIPAWLTDKEKASPNFFVDRIKAGEYFRDIIVESLSAFVDKQAKGRPSTDDDILDYVVRVGVRFLSGFSDKVSVETIFRCLTSFKFIQRRIRNNRIEIYSLIEDFKLSAECQADVDVKKQVRHEICSALESNVYVLSEFPNLLHNCFRFTSKTAQSVVIPDCVSTVWMEYSWLPRPASKIRRDMSCLALSPDKKLLAGGSEGFIYLFDACTFENVQGPIKVLEMNIDHLEFSPDGKFLFFGKLDKWFSVDQGCVKELPQFAGNYRFYKWGSFIFDGRYIVVEGIDPELRGHELNCLVNIFGMWAMRELEQMPEFDITSLRVSNRFESFRLSKCNRQVKKKHSVRRFTIFKHRIQNALVGVKSLCPECSEFEKSYENKSLALLRQRVIELYPEIFKYQIWDTTSGRPALEEAFSPGVQLNPFFFLCHLTFDHDDTFFTGAEKSVSLCTVAFVNAVFYLSLNEYGLSYTHRAESEDLGQSFWLSSLVVTNTPRGFENWPARGRLTVSPDRTWIVVRRSNNEVHLFNKQMQLDHFDYRKPIHVIKEAVDYVTFAEDSSFLLYLTKHGSPHALCLQTGSVLSSVSGFILQSCMPGKEVGYCFRSGNEETIIFARHFVGGLCGVLSNPPFTSPHFMVTYSSADTIKSISSCAILTSWKRTNSDLPFTVVSRCCLRASPAPSGGREAHMKNCAFSRNGEFLATHQGSKILLFKYDEFSIYTVYEGEDDYTVSCLTFSADSTLLLFCMKRCNNTSSFSVWDVQNKVVLSSKLLYLLAVDCCCFSSDNMKVIICEQVNIQIWEYAGNSCRRLKALEPPGLFTGFDKFTHCSVSSNNQMLACCIRDKILLYPFNPPRQQDVLEIPHGHLGRVEFCQFLKGTRYLISYGVDGTVFLCDINEWKAVAYVRVTQGSESILSMAVSPEEDEVVCLTSLDRFCIIQLCGLKCAKLSSFPLLNMNASERVTPVESRGQQRERTVPTFQGAATSDSKDISENDWLFMLSSDENEDSEEDELESDRWASNIRCT